SVIRFCKVNIPVSGGGYFRLYPVSWTARCLRQINHRLGQPFMFYIHPWELDSEQPRLGIHGWQAWRHYLNLASTSRKLEWLLTQFRFGRMDEVLESYFSSAAMAPSEPQPSIAPSNITECA